MTDGGEDAAKGLITPDDHAEFASLNDHEDGEEHVDERWLVSYADMMTLLFGLFVMLYSMASKFDTVQKSAAKEFNKTSANPVSVSTPAAPLAPDLSPQLAQLRQQNDEKQKRLQELELHLNSLEVQISTQKTAREADQVLLASAHSQLDELLKSGDKSKLQNEKIKEYQSSLNASKAALAQEQAAVAREKSELTQTLKKTDEITRALSSSQTEIQDLKQQLKLQAQAAAPKATPFAAVVITWPSQDHDIDLVVTDPSGQAFDFKHRKVKGHPGDFVLDTRHGPGAEMWQTDKIIAGTYKLRYIFYNDYGNNAPAEVSSTIYSLDGAFTLPIVKLDFASKREQIFKFKVSQQGHVSLIND